MKKNFVQFEPGSFEWFRNPNGFKWFRYDWQSDTHPEEEKILAGVLGGEAYQPYLPLTEDPVLFRRFSQVKLTMDGVVDFANTYGSLSISLPPPMDDPDDPSRQVMLTCESFV